VHSCEVQCNCAVFSWKMLEEIEDLKYNDVSKVCFLSLVDVLCCTLATCPGSCRCTVCCVVHRQPVPGLVSVQCVVLCTSDLSRVL